MPRPIRIVVLVSGGGSNLQAILDAQQSGRLGEAGVVLVVSSKPGAYALERASRAGVPSAVVDPKTFSTDAEFQSAVLREIVKVRADVVVLAGYLRKLGPDIVHRFKKRILNIHPALLPKFGGAGMYGHFVHDAVLKAGDSESGCSVHVVDEEFDHGPVLAQAKVPVLPGDTPDLLAARVLEQEHLLYPRVIADYCAALNSPAGSSPRGEVTDPISEKGRKIFP